MIDASGHQPVFMRRPAAPVVAYQAAYGIVGNFQPPAGDRRAHGSHGLPHRPSRGQHQDTAPPTFLYAMDLGDGRYFVEETSLAHALMVRLDLLAAAQPRAGAHGVAVEKCTRRSVLPLPMNPPMPYRTSRCWATAARRAWSILPATRWAPR
ncbi:MAG: lycopene cyclase family protein [Caldilineaceae bacterium]